MSLPRKFVLMLGTAGCASALVLLGSIPGPQPFDLSTPLRFEVLAGFEPMVEEDAAMLALRQRARAALAGLQTATVAPR